MKKNKNESLQLARFVKNNEFYTPLSIINKEMEYYKNHFKGKVVYCNCDDPVVSQFYFYFKSQFKNLGLKKLIASTYRNADSDARRPKADFVSEEKEKENNKKMRGGGRGKLKKGEIRRAVYIEYTGDKTGAPRHMHGDEKYHGGDFRSDESIELLKQADIVCTNPPFSLFREYVAQLIKYKKQFLILGDMNAIGFIEIFPLVKENKIWVGVNNGSKEFYVPEWAEKYSEKRDGEKIMKIGRIYWYTNLVHNKRTRGLTDMLTKAEYEKQGIEYTKYQNYNAMEIASNRNHKVQYIPSDYSGVMGVPTSFMDKFSPDQFEIIGFDYEVNQGLLPELVNPKWKGKLDRGYVNGKRKFSRILIRHKHPSKT